MEWIEYLKVVILGIIEGITEWLPISSTGHMILADEFIRLGTSDAFKEVFFVVIQLGAILAVIVMNWRKMIPISFSPKSAFGFIDMKTISLWLKVVVASIPAALVGIPFEDDLDRLFYNYQTVALMLILYGVWFIVLENRNKNKHFSINSLEQVTYKTAFLIGLFQVLSLVPGTSRSGTTILGAMLIGTSRTVAAEFTFFLAVPAMFGASLIKMLKFGFDFTRTELSLLLTGMAVAFVVSILAIKFLMTYIKKHDFKLFGYYRIILGALVLAYFLFS